MEKFDGTFYGEPQYTQTGHVLQSTLELREISENDFQEAFIQILIKGGQMLSDTMFHEMLEMLTDEQREKLVGKHFNEFKKAFADKIEERDKELAKEINDNYYDYDEDE